MVFSGCGTGVSGPQYGNELVGVALAATEAGAGAVLATLWPVDDWTTGRFMAAFYTELHRHRHEPTVDLLAVLDVARTAVRAELAVAPAKGHRRDGRDLVIETDGAVAPREFDGDLAAQQLWAPFVIFGDPVLRHAP